MKKFVVVWLGVMVAWGQMVSSDMPYRVMGDESQEVIFTAPDAHVAQSLDAKLHKLHPQYAHSFDHNLTQRNYTILGSYHNQVANAIATFYPLLRNEFYSGGASMIDYFGAASWLDEIIVHEVAHTYQLDAKVETSEVLQNIYGNNGMWFINPNYLLPTFLIEGNAVMNESRAGIGGRLYVGEHRALVYALSKGGALNYTRLLNNHIDFPYTTEKYLVGGYFFAYLSQLYGVDKVNAFFKAHAKHYMNPLWLNDSFREHFGYEYRTLIGGFLMQLHQETQKMQLLEGEVLARGHSYGALNHDTSSIGGMLIDQEGPNRLYAYDKKSGAFTIQKSTLLTGKVFAIEGKNYSTSQGYSAPNRIETGLFDENAQLLPSTSSRHILDRRASHEAYFDMRDAYETPMLYVDNRAIDRVNSSAILDDVGAVYYAKQEGDTRTLYREGVALGSFAGYWSKLIEVVDGKLYFIANSDYGASLYRLSQGKIERLSHADNIVDARLIDEAYFLAVTVDAQGYALQKAPLETAQEALPASYSYALAPLDITLEVSHEKASAPYVPLQNLHLATFLPMALFDVVNGWSLYGTIDFVDPMMYNYVGLGGGKLLGTQSYMAMYSNLESLLNYSLLSAYIDDPIYGQIAQAQGLVSYVLSRSNRHVAQVVSQYDGMWGDMSSQSITTSGRVVWGEHYGMAQDWHRYIGATLAHRLINGRHAGIVQVDATYELLPTLFALGYAKVGVAQSDDLSLRRDSFTWYSDATTSTLNSTALAMKLRQLGQLQTGLKKAFRTPLYDAVLPIGIRRTMVEASASAIFFDASSIKLTQGKTVQALDANAYSRMYELNVGVSWEFLLAHLSPLNVGIDYSYNSIVKSNDFLLKLGTAY
ncbi:MAG: hypothetical protein KU37_07430 [Sulfuricurvum sp. PC08-66]|nr:MAG: hypothetical protein KU37_07430 [Sulfuricurvum sp. PC08-66]